MIRHLNVHSAHSYNFNLEDTYLFVEGRHQRGNVENYLKQRGYKFRVLFQGTAINHYYVHRGDWEDSDVQRLRQTLLIIEIDELPKK